MAKANEVRTKHPDEARNCAVSFDAVLDADETLTGTPTVTFTPAGLTASNVQVNSTALTINGDSVAIGRAVQFQVAGGAAGVKYTGTVQAAGTTASSSQTPLVVIQLLVTANG